MLEEEVATIQVGEVDSYLIYCIPDGSFNDL